MNIFRAAMVGALGVSMLLMGCQRQKEATAHQAYQLQLANCREQFLKNPLVPIVGGGHLDTRRFGFNMPTVRYENGQGGTDGFETSFYWTGEKIYPDAKAFTGKDIRDIPPQWRYFNVTTRMGNRSFCREHPQQCQSSLSRR